MFHPDIVSVSPKYSQVGFPAVTSVPRVSHSLALLGDMLLLTRLRRQDAPVVDSQLAVLFEFFDCAPRP